MPKEQVMPPAPTQPRYRSETTLAPTLCLLFKLSPAEGRVCAKLLTNDFCSKRELCTVVMNLTVILCTLRAKLKPHGVSIFTLHGRGYGLDVKSRNEICKLLAEHDAGIALVRPKPKATKSEQTLEVS